MRKTGPILILIIGIAALIIVFAPGLRVPDATSADGQRTIETKLGLDLQGGLRVEYLAKQVGDKIPRPEDLEVIRDIIERRVNATGVSEPVITTQGTDRVVVELPGVSDPNAVRELVGQTGRLDFVPLGSALKNVDDDDRPRAVPAAVQRRAARGGDDRPGPDGGSRRPRSSSSRTAPSCSSDYTRDHVGEYFAIVLDSRVISAPSIDERDPRRTGPDPRRAGSAATR